MRIPAKTRLAGTSVAILTWLTVAGATSAQTPAGRDVGNVQVQLGDAFASQTLNVTDAGQVVSQATAASNIVSAIGQNADLSLTNRQTVDTAHTTAAAQVAIAGYADYVGATASATGNSATAGTCCGLTSGSSVQAVTPSSDVNAGAFVTAPRTVGQISADSLAVGNTQGWLAANGLISTPTTQTLNSAVAADTEVTAGRVLGLAGSSATAVGNDVTTSATNSSVDITSTQTTADNSVTATLTSQQQSGDTIVGQATATGNNVSLQNDGGGSDSNHTQVNGAGVTADAAYGLGTWNSASVGAYGVGNSVLVSNVGPATEIATDQTNTGFVTAKASLLGGGGADGVVSATAVGNAVSAYVCATCDGGVGATNTQTNRGAITATSVYRGPATGNVTGSASAVGNSATYQVKSSGG